MHEVSGHSTEAKLENFCSGSMLPRRKTQFASQHHARKHAWLIWKMAKDANMFVATHPFPLLVRHEFWWQAWSWGLPTYIDWKGFFRFSFSIVHLSCFVHSPSLCNEIQSIYRFCWHALILPMWCYIRCFLVVRLMSFIGFLWDAWTCIPPTRLDWKGGTSTLPWSKTWSMIWNTKREVDDS